MSPTSSLSAAPDDPAPAVSQPIGESRAPPPPDAAPDEDVVRAMLAAIDARVPFGPGFFMTQLRAFVRDRCPDPTEALPTVELTLESGEICDVCHVIGIAPHWVALAVREPRAGDEHAMRTELVPYATIRRVTIRPTAAGSGSIGFDRDHGPVVVGDILRSPEAILDRAAGHGSKS